MSFFDIFRIDKIKQAYEAQIHSLEEQLSQKEKWLNDLGIPDYSQTKHMTDMLKSEIANLELTKQQLQFDIDNSSLKLNKSESKITSNVKKLNKVKEIYDRISYAIDNYTVKPIEYSDCKISSSDVDELNLLSPSVTPKLHCMDIKDLRKAARSADKEIDKLLEQYSSRYTTKANQSIYSLMVIALRAELQNILYSLKYEKLDKAIADVKAVSSKYLNIAASGNQSIAGTLTKFIGEIEYLFINKVKIEYNYYVKKEQAKQEQAAIREQMRQEAEERKALEMEKKRIAKEEEKYIQEIAKLKDLLNTSSENDSSQYQERIVELESHLSDVIIKKDEITNLQNGKAGNVYIISNLGSFGENVFKIGMTRRLDPQDRVNELGNASVPFKFDVHSFIFSNDAVTLETNLHNRLNNKRVNKVNLRKEFFNCTIDELENLVLELDPTAEFNRTMLAEEFRQSQSSDEIYSTDYQMSDNDEDED